MSDFCDRICSEEHKKQLSAEIENIEHQTKLLNYSWSKGDWLRVSNLLLATGRIADALARKTQVEALERWVNSIESASKSQLANFSKEFQYVLEREHEKHCFEVRMSEIQSIAESGCYPREAISKYLRELAAKVEGGAFPILLPATSTPEELQEYAEAAVKDFNEAQRKAKKKSPVKAKAKGLVSVNPTVA